MKTVFSQILMTTWITLVALAGATAQTTGTFERTTASLRGASVSTQTTASETAPVPAAPAEDAVTSPTPPAPAEPKPAEAVTTATETLTTAPAMATPTETTTTTETQSPAEVAVESEGTSVTLDSGVVYAILKPGSGREADTTSTRLIHYTLYLAGGGKVESSRDRMIPAPFVFTPDAGEAISGMQEGTDGMRIGEVRRIYVPASEAYGETGQENVPPNSDLVFIVELVDLKDPSTQTQTEDVASPLMQ